MQIFAAFCALGIHNEGYNVRHPHFVRNFVSPPLDTFKAPRRGKAYRTGGAITATVVSNSFSCWSQQPPRCPAHDCDEKLSTRCGDRTHDHTVKSRALFRLS
mmetsp:Transcript_5663/g.8307  ORF Transcript_5663/g.8307 Transcript_5663/m.8307 type:complete len:102 (-) Transcript_5663:167-472(-)